MTETRKLSKINSSGEAEINDNFLIDALGDLLVEQKLTNLYLEMIYGEDLRNDSELENRP